VNTPNITEITRRPAPVDHDTFIDDLSARRPGPIVDPRRGGR
jgi:hypothetical protein